MGSYYFDWITAKDIELPDDRHSVMDDEMHVDHPDWPGDDIHPSRWARLITRREIAEGIEGLISPP